jgi:alpha-glucosidase
MSDRRPAAARAETAPSHPLNAPDGGRVARAGPAAAGKQSIARLGRGCYPWFAGQTERGGEGAVPDTKATMAEMAEMAEMAGLATVVTAETPWWRGAIIYQIYPRSFRDGNGDGIGDLPGVLEGLPHVAGLGVDAIWISPFVRSPQKDFGYDVSDYTAVDPLFGTLEDFDAVVAEAHRLGLKVLMDQVFSHTSDEHPWFVSSRADAAGPHGDWYVWVDPQADGGPPNRWLGVFGGGAWTWEPRRHQYYLHHFLPEQPALDLRNPAVVEALLAAGRFWLERGVDGFRLDAIDFMMHDPSLADNPARHLPYKPLKPFSLQRHVHDMAHPETLHVLGRIRDLLDAFGATVAMAEVGSESCAEDPLTRAARYTAVESGDRRRADGGGTMHMAYSLRMMKQPGTAEGLGAFFEEAEAEIGSGWLTWAFSNHDVVRVVSRWGGGDLASAPLFMALLLSMRGTLCLYQGEEVGLPEAEVDLAHLQDPFGRAYWPEFKGRDGCRTPLPWTAEGPAAGFSRTAGPTWLPIDPAHRRLAIDRQDADAASMLHATRRLIAWRKAHPVLRLGALTVRRAVAPPLLVVERGAGTADALVLIFNLSAAETPLPADLAAGESLPGVAGPAGGVLPPWGAAVLGAGGRQAGGTAA